MLRTVTGNRQPHATFSSKRENPANAKVRDRPTPWFLSRDRSASQNLTIVPSTIFPSGTHGSYPASQLSQRPPRRGRAWGPLGNANVSQTLRGRGPSGHAGRSAKSRRTPDSKGRGGVGPFGRTPGPRRRRGTPPSLGCLGGGGRRWHRGRGRRDRQGSQVAPQPGC